MLTDIGLGEPDTDAKGDLEKLGRTREQLLDQIRADFAVTTPGAVATLPASSRWRRERPAGDSPTL